LGAALENFSNILEVRYGRGMRELGGKCFAEMIEYRYIVGYLRGCVWDIETARIESLLSFFD
jgi:hypothetical protein